MRLVRFLLMGALTLGLIAYWAGTDGADSAGLPQVHTPSKGKHIDEAYAGDHPHTAPHGGIVMAVAQHHLELTFEKRIGLMTLYVLGDRELAAHPIPTEPLTVRVEPVDADAFTGPFEVELLPIAQDGDPGGFASRFVGSDGELHGLQRFEATVQAPLHGKTHDVAFAVDPAAFNQVFVCPMRCEGGRAYTNGGQCPFCNMRLRLPQDAHRDHSTKHGGVLFMAPNGWHHLEGTLPSRHEFRLYLYNDFTKPIAATPFVHGSWVEIVALDEHRTAVGEPVKLAFGAAAEGEYLRVPIPEGMSVPLEIEVRLQFEGREGPDLFHFNFDEVSH